MQEKIKNYSAEINAFEPKNAEELENFRIQFLGRKGILNELFEIFKALPGEEKKTAGKIMNEFKVLIEQKIELYKGEFLGDAKTIKAKKKTLEKKKKKVLEDREAAKKAKEDKLKEKPIN